MSRLRRAYYDKFSSYYDRFVALHSRDPQGLARTILAGCIPVQNGGSVLDLCTVTGTLLSRLLENVGASGLVVGLDSSRGMLNMAHAKTRGFPNIRLIEADAGHLPFKPRLSTPSPVHTPSTSSRGKHGTVRSKKFFASCGQTEPFS